MPKTTLGALRETFVLYQRSAVADTQGGRVLTPVVLASVPAAVRPSAGASESLGVGKVAAIAGYEVEIVYRADVTPLMKGTWTPYLGVAKTLEIQAVTLKDGRADRLLLACLEVQA